MSEIDYKRYLNIITFGNWRKYDLISKKHDEQSFRQDMQANQYIIVEFFDSGKSKKVLLYLFDKNSKYVNSQELNIILKKIPDNNIVLLIMYEATNVYQKKVISAHKSLTISAYRHELFDIIIPNGPLCYPHRILSREEVLRLTNEELCCYVTNLPKIQDDDPQCIWIGAQLGDVIEKVIYSDIIGETYQYAVVISKSKPVQLVAKDNSTPVSTPINTSITKKSQKITKNKSNVILGDLQDLEDGIEPDNPDQQKSEDPDQDQELNEELEEYREEIDNATDEESIVESEIDDKDLD